jgi:hypothetical protein
MFQWLVAKLIQFLYCSIMYIGREGLFWDFLTYRLLFSDFICISLQLQCRLECHVRDVNNYSVYVAVQSCLYSSLFRQQKNTSELVTVMLNYTDIKSC